MPIRLLVVVALIAATCAASVPVADVVSVERVERDGELWFAVGISSPDTGCDLYADWWEVLSEDGELLYRRVLGHSHVDEQPFVRSGGPVSVEPDQTVWVRAHMSPGGYGGQAYKGSVANGFEPADLRSDFAPEAAEQEPLPEGCEF